MIDVTVTRYSLPDRGYRRLTFIQPKGAGVAKTNRNEDLFGRLRASGVRKRTAKLLADATDRRRKPAKSVHQTITELKRLVSEAEDRISGGPAKRKAAAKKAAATRKRNAAKRSTAAKKAARTRAKA
jgi:hypothetical protein